MPKSFENDDIISIFDIASKIWMAIKQNWKSIIAISLIVLAVISANPTQNQDNSWSDMILRSKQQVANLDYLVVSVNQSDYIKMGKPFDRRELTAAVLKIKELGADRLLLDFWLSGENISEVDKDLSNAMSRFDKADIAFGASDSSEFIAPNYFQDSATQLSLALNADSDKQNRSIKSYSNQLGGNPAVWLSTGKISRNAVEIDARIAPKSINVLSLSQLKDLPSNSLNGKIVILGIDKKLSFSRVRLPAYGEIDRGLFFAIAANSYQNKYDALAQQSLKLRTLSVTLALIAGLYIGLRVSSFSVFSRSVALIVVFIFFTSFFVTDINGFRTYPFTITGVFMIAAYIALAKRLRLLAVFSGFLEGNLSPEESWAWSSYQNSGKPAVLFGANGLVKKINNVAIEKLGLSLVDKDNCTSFAKLCYPSIGERAKRMVLTGSDNVWSISWPKDEVSLALFDDITNQATRERNLKQANEVDHLTGLLNRRAFDEAIEKLNSSENREYGILFLDMNGFKEVNDNLGHSAGDELLRQVAERLRPIMPTRSILARFGGDEFAAIVYGINRETELRKIANALERTTEMPFNLNGSLVDRISFAIGYALASENQHDALKLLAIADKNMYKAKTAVKVKSLVANQVSAIIKTNINQKKTAA